MFFWRSPKQYTMFESMMIFETPCRHHVLLVQCQVSCSNSCTAVAYTCHCFAGAVQCQLSSSFPEYLTCWLFTPSKIRHTIHTFSCCLVQIYTLTQQAMSMVKAFPYVAEKPQIFDVMAAERGELSARGLMQPAGLDNIEHNAKWQQIVQYLATVTADNLDLHVPIVLAS